MSDLSCIVNFKSIYRWLVVITIYWISGYILKSAFGLITLAVFIAFYFINKFDFQVYILILWMFIHKYFIGVLYISDEGIVLYNSSIFCLFLIVIFSKQLPAYISNQFNRVLLINSGLFFIVLILSFFLNNYNILRLLNVLLFILLFLALSLSNFNRETYFNLVNLILAIGIFQIPISALQFLGVLPPPFNFSSGTLSGIDDAACGTFGSSASPDLSLFLSFLFVILFILFFKTHNYRYIILGFFYLIHYTLVDSKTILFVLILMVCLAFLLDRSLRSSLNFLFTRKSIFILTLATLLIVFGMKRYYDRSFAELGRDSDFYKEYVKQSSRMALTNLSEWGKIKGFKDVYTSNSYRNKLTNILGRGYGEFDWAGFHGTQKYMSYRLRIDNYINSFLNNRSSLIEIYANVGIAGLFTLLLIYFGIYKHIGSIRDQVSAYSEIDAFSLAFKPFLIGCLVLSFIYVSWTENALATLEFWIILAIYEKIRTLENEELVEINKSKNKVSHSGDVITQNNTVTS